MAKLCGNCGTQLNWPAQQQPQHPPVYQQSQQQWDYEHGQTKAKQQKTSSWLIVSITLVVVVLLVGGGVFAFNAISGKTPPSSSPSITPPSSAPPTGSPPASDATVPTITNVAASPMETSAVITWTTSEPATSQVEYGKTADHDSASTLNQALVVSHSITLSSLEPSTTYHFRVKSKDDTGNEAISGNYILVTSKPATEVGGIISSDTTWAEVNSPYLITSTVQIPTGVTLTIEPGVSIAMPSSGDMFLLHGTLSALGAINNEIVLDGQGNSVVITAEGGSGSAELNYCVIRNALMLWDEGGHFRLTHCELINLTSSAGNPLHKQCVLLDNPTGDTYIEYNKFVNSGAVTVYQAAGRDGNVYIRYNLFQNMLSPIHHAGGTPGTCQLIVNYNSFIDTEGMVLWLEQDFETASINGIENYWGTTDTDIIDQKIYDKNDDIRVKNYINYLPILTEPHSDTPQADQG